VSINKSDRLLLNTISGAGVSRSATILAAYLMNKHKIDRDTALARIKEVRRRIDPNAYFRSTLASYGKKLGIS
jgi:protein-tyrosine phosphatase